MSVPEGSTSYHPYSLKDKDGVVVPSVEGLEYKISTWGKETVLDWTALPLLPSGAIEVTAEQNTIAASETSSTTSLMATVGRYITLRATHNGGKTIAGEIQYDIEPLVGV